MVRKLIKSDLINVKHLVDDQFFLDLQKIIISDKGEWSIFLYEENSKSLGVILGMTYLSLENKKLGSIEGLFVKPQHRRRGVGKLLIEALEKEWKLKGVKEIFVNIDYKGNSNPKLFYIKTGYIELNHLVGSFHKVL